MSTETNAASTETHPTWPVLPVGERRVLGVLVEKAKTTPEAYPMSINALTNGCNQKSNRDPVMNLLEEDVQEILFACQKKGLVTKVIGGRVDRWRHNLYDQWKLEKVEAAIVTELLLRGPQTEGELRSRAGRMEPIDDLDTLRQKLAGLEERKLIVYLGPKDRRGVMVSHGFHTKQELDIARSGMVMEDVSSPTPPHVPSPRASSLETGLNEAKAEIAALKSQMQDLQAEVKKLKDALGVS